MELNWIEVVGYAGTGFTIASYSAKRIMPLRIVAILSSLSFLIYGLMTESYPIVLMELILLPINGYRLIELVRDRSRAPV